jgi:hypothetical protein
MVATMVLFELFIYVGERLAPMNWELEGGRIESS